MVFGLNLVKNRTRCTYRTKNNRWKLVRTPGNRLVRQKIAVRAGAPHCPISGAKLNGLPALPRNSYKSLSKSKRTVSRPYGGKYSHTVVREKILKSFLNYEKLCVQAVLMEKAKTQKQAEGKKTKKH